MDLFKEEEELQKTKKEKQIREFETLRERLKFRVANELVNGNFFEAKRGFNQILEVNNKILNLKHN